jgi:hypothetical protein
MKWFLFIIFTLLLNTQIKGEDKIHVYLGYENLVGLYEKSSFLGYSTTNSLSGFDLNITGMYDLNKRLSIGIGTTIEKLYNPHYTTFPIYSIANYSPLKTYLKPYVFGKIGYGINSKKSNPGVLLETGIGYKRMFHQHFGLNFTLGYHFRTIEYDVTIDNIKVSTESNYRHSIALGFGFIF